MSFTTDSLREDARKKFAPVEVVLGNGSKIKLSSLLRLKKEDRELVKGALSAITDVEDDADETEGLEQIVEQSAKIITIIADKPVKLLKELDDPDLLVKVSMMTSVIAGWATATQLGEARNSPDS